MDRDQEMVLKYDTLDREIVNIQKEIKPFQLRLKELKIERNLVKEELCKSIVSDVSKPAICIMPRTSEEEAPSKLKFSISETPSMITKETLKNNILSFFLRIKELSTKTKSETQDPFEEDSGVEVEAEVEEEESIKNFFYLDPEEQTNTLFKYMYSMRPKAIKYKALRVKVSKKELSVLEPSV